MIELEMLWGREKGYLLERNLARSAFVHGFNLK
jgi:hypothetical protein